MIYTLAIILSYISGFVITNAWITPEIKPFPEAKEGQTGKELSEAADKWDREEFMLCVKWPVTIAGFLWRKIKNK